MKPASQAIRDDTVDDVQAKAGVAEIAARRKEWVEGFAPDIWIHAAAIVGKNNLNMIIAARLDLDVDGALLAVRKRVR
jgi:hypothetical protein